MAKFILTEKDLKSLAGYLGSKPWGEVNNLLVMLMKLEKIEDKEEKELPKKE